MHRTGDLRFGLYVAGAVAIVACAGVAILVFHPVPPLGLPATPPIYGVVVAQKVGEPATAQAKVMSRKVLHQFLMDNLGSATAPSAGPVDCGPVTSTTLKYVVTLYYPHAIRAFSFLSAGCPVFTDLSNRFVYWSHRLSRGLSSMFTGSLTGTLAEGSRTCNLGVATDLAQSQGQAKLVDGDGTHGWLFEEFGAYVYVGPKCQGWFPVTVGAVTNAVRSVNFSNGDWTLTGTGSGSDASGAPSIPPYLMMVDPATGLETVQYTGAPVAGMPGVFVLPLTPNGPPVNVRSLLVQARGAGISLTLSTDLPKRATFSLVGGPKFTAQGAPTSTYQLVMEGAALDAVSVPSDLPVDVVISRGLPSPDWASIYSHGAWRLLPSDMNFQPGQDAYTVDIRGIPANWTVSSSVADGVISLTFAK